MSDDRTPPEFLGMNIYKKFAEFNSLIEDYVERSTLVDIEDEVYEIVEETMWDLYQAFMGIGHPNFQRRTSLDKFTYERR